MDIISLPNEILYKIMLNLPIYYLFRFCICCKRLYFLFKDNSFWLRKTMKDFPEKIKHKGIYESQYFSQYHSQYILQLNQFRKTYCIWYRNYDIPKKIFNEWTNKHTQLELYRNNIENQHCNIYFIFYYMEDKTIVNSLIIGLTEVYNLYNIKVLVKNPSVTRPFQFKRFCEEYIYHLNTRNLIINNQNRNLPRGFIKYIIDIGFVYENNLFIKRS